ncbi:MAG: DUF1080 domain-containing protein [Planctomycetota bacterium]
MRHAPYTLAAAILLATCMLGLAHALDGHRPLEAKPAAEDGFTVLFDGTSTEHFRKYNGEAFPDKGWTVEDGTIRVIGKTRGSGDIITKKQYSDFDLRWEWKVVEGSNSGIMYRVEEVKNQPTYKTGPEYQILEDGAHRDGKNPKTSAAALYALIECNEKKSLKPIGEWNTSRILIKDSHVKHYLNGDLVVEYVWGSDDIKAKIANSKFKNWGDFMTKDKGHIAFQYHNDDVWFRNIRIKDLSGE